VLPLFSPAAQQPTKRYRTIVADPPWPIEMGPTLTQKRVKPALEYPTMSIEELAGLPIGLWATDRAHLYLWTTSSMLDHAIRLSRVWGFKYSTVITWIKRRPVNDGWMGLGRYYRSTTEHVVFAVRGGLDVLNKDQPNFFFAPRGAHSEKPAAFYDMVQHMSHPPYLDVFARKQRFGWDTWGDEAFDFRTDGIWHREPPDA
jgi:N6-adenosine-specific RNA methylase IME4